MKVSPAMTGNGMGAISENVVTPETVLADRIERVKVAFFPLVNATRPKA
jgi:hypothetical protein